MNSAWFYFCQKLVASIFQQTIGHVQGYILAVATRLNHNVSENQRIGIYMCRHFFHGKKWVYRALGVFLNSSIWLSGKRSKQGQINSSTGLQWKGSRAQGSFVCLTTIQAHFRLKCLTGADIERVPRFLRPRITTWYLIWPRKFIGLQSLKYRVAPPVHSIQNGLSLLTPNDKRWRKYPE